MKKTLKEELERIHTLNYGGILKKRLSLFEDEKKADLVKDDVTDFFKTLGNIDEPISEQKYGSQTYQKDVETIQIGLELLGYDLPQYGIDGLFGSETANAVKKFKSDNNLKQEGGKVTMTKDDINKMNELLKSKNIKSEDIKTFINQSIETSNRNYEKIDKRGQELLKDDLFKNKLKDVCQYLEIEPEWLLKIMKKESGFNPSIVNSIGCVGLVQFCPDIPRGGVKTINNIKYNLSELSQSPLLQLDAIKDLYKIYKGRIKNYSDLYLITFYPAAFGKSDNYVIGSNSGNENIISKQNPAIARAAGKTPGQPITVGDFKDYANA